VTHAHLSTSTSLGIDATFWQGGMTRTVLHNDILIRNDRRFDTERLVLFDFFHNRSASRGKMWAMRFDRCLIPACPWSTGRVVPDNATATHYCPGCEPPEKK
jgi:hypothetical protein